MYEDAERAAAYATLAYPGTYSLAFRDLPALLAEHAAGTSALDFGCGAGRSTRFLREQGFDSVGVDISEAMVAQARAADPAGEYHVVPGDDLSVLGARRFDLIFAAFTFDNVPGHAWRATLLGRLRGFLREEGRIVLLDSTPEIYTHEWLSFTTKAFPENRRAKSGERVRIVMTDVPDQRPVEDLVWFDEDYARLFAEARLRPIRTHRPLGRPDEPYAWVSETTVAPWVIYVLERRD